MIKFPSQMDDATRRKMLAEAKKGLPHAKRVFAISAAAFCGLTYMVFKKPSEQQIY